ncbi:hypothetical protein BDV40DRAFT_287595 [Aspergillus tamarii]|uniref:Uncharacterized protein n=1 Tax=Aspergillus tamarii TaxID=41984 RepID=A0A5N6UYK6_ASPTM|nr:hypothetical protein BDV40DRAFT_287595 [Aspergillus tamarii]
MTWVVKQGRLDILQMYLKAGKDSGSNQRDRSGAKLTSLKLFKLICCVSESLTALVVKAVPGLLYEQNSDARTALNIELNEITNAVDVGWETAFHIAAKRDLWSAQLSTGRQDVDINGLIYNLLRDRRIHIHPMSVLAMKHLTRPTALRLLLLSEEVLLLIRFSWLHVKQAGCLSYLMSCQMLLFAFLPYIIWFAHLPLIIWVFSVGSCCVLV